jgi:hypothetical protein
MPELILGIIDGIIKLAIVVLAGIPPEIRAQREAEFQADLDWWRKVLNLYVPNLPAPPPKVP